jgi:hypothetical protein
MQRGGARGGASGGQSHDVAFVWVQARPSHAV